MNKSILLILVSTLLLSSCFDEYFDHFERQNSIPKHSMIEKGSLSGLLIILPDKSELSKLIEKISKAKDRVWIETYTWTEKGTLDQVIKLGKGGKDVRVILEGNVYGTPKINDAAVNLLKQEGLQVVYASSDFTFTHMKMWIIDDEWCISTGNWSYSSFTKNREFIFCSHDKSILNSLEEIFISDFKHLPPIFEKEGMDKRIGIAPLNLREFLVFHLSQAKNEIILYNQTVSDEEILKYLSLKKKQNLNIEICQSTKSNSTIFGNTLSSYASEGPYLHAKVYLIDGKDIILGSANMTKNALENNREIMIKIENNKEIYNAIRNLYNIDCKKQH